MIGPIIAGLSALPWGKIGGGLGKLFGKGKIDPTTALLGGLSLFGGDGQQEMGSFRGAGVPGIVDPIQSLYQAIKASHLMGEGLSKRPHAQLRSSVIQPGPEPVQIPGLGFQIGGGLGRDPALDNPALLMSDRNQGLNDIMGSFFGGADKPPTSNRTAQPKPLQRRNPTNDR